MSSSKAFHDAIKQTRLPESDEPDNDEGVNELNAEFNEADSDEESQNSSDNNGRATLSVCLNYFTLYFVACLSLHNLISFNKTQLSNCVTSKLLLVVLSISII